jgi:hypothetical protein
MGLDCSSCAFVFHVPTVPKFLEDAADRVAKAVNNGDMLFDPSQFANPALQKHYQVLQAMALDTALESEVDDALNPPDLSQVTGVLRVFNEKINQAAAALPVPQAPAAKSTAAAAKRKVRDPVWLA